MFFEHTGAQNLDQIHKELRTYVHYRNNFEEIQKLKKNYTSVDCKNLKIESYKEYTKVSQDIWTIFSEI